MTEMKRNRAVFPIVAGVLALSALGGLTWQQQVSDTAARAQDAQILKLEQSVTDLSKQTTNAASQAVALAAGAPSGEVDAALGRLNTDKSAIETFVKTAFVWKDQASYDAARDSIARVWQLDPNGSFLKTFLPEAPMSTDSTGKKYSYIDAAGLNSSVGSVTVKLTGVQGTEYHYLVMVSVLASSTDGSDTASRASVLEFTSVEAGKFTSIQGWTSPTQSRVSGTDHAG
ncbi:MAG TPA: hypothetical protein VFU07_05240 [Candidatus Lumbricidophila sp.]|nr:hypothetical protein [Candidatus Lumbricidophila sp.]